MNRNKLSAYGQEFEDDDEEGSTVSKKPTQIHEEIATDEKGKRRFHGAFTGGFSAGYWNTVGSKQGWVPQTFTSSRDERGDKIKQRAEDFMDAEDLGEFGIGSRSIKQTSEFGDGRGGSSGQKRKMAWERDSVSTMTQLFEDVVKPVSNSIGVRMLRSMGWREGRGIGLANVKQKQDRGGMSEEAQFDREQASKVAPAYEFANEDSLVKQLTPLTGAHGIGYQGLRQTTVLDESYGRTALALKSDKRNSKGIRGQAFGVGAFEEEDESVYSNYDLSQFDFSLDVAGTSEESNLKTQKIDTAFELQPKRLNPRKFYAAPRVPPNFRGEHRPIPMDVSRLPQVMKDDVKGMTAVQRAKFLGEDRVKTLEICGKEAPKERRSRWDIKANEVEQREHQRGGEDDEERDRRQRNRVEFPNEPQRQARFKEFLTYIRRGLPYPQPTDLTVWEWEWEKKEFESKLTTEERGMLPEVQSRAQPLARTAISAPIHEMMASKFVKESGSDLKVGTKDEDKLAAVKMEMFGDRTRQSYEWYPDNLLCKRFNVPHPYPGAEMVGVPALQKTNWKKKNTLEDIGGVTASIGMPNTANEIQMRERLLKSKAQRTADERKRKDSDDEEKRYDDAEKDPEESDDSDDEMFGKKEDKAPKSFFDFLFGEKGEMSSSSDDSEDEREDERLRMEVRRKREEEVRKIREEKEKKAAEEWKKNEAERIRLEQGYQKERSKKEEEDEIQIINEVTKESKTFGPALPPKTNLSNQDVLKLLEKNIKRKDESRKKKHKKDRKHSKKSKKSSKKSKKEKKKKRSRSPSSDDDSSDDSDEWQEKK
ncbi:unnamed protein product [Caenorhabditis brenneri]